MEKAATRAFSWLKAATTAFTFKTLLRNLSLIHISEPTRLGMISYAVFCLKKVHPKVRNHGEGPY